MSNLDRRHGTDTKPQSMMSRPGLLQIGRGTTGRKDLNPNQPRINANAGENARSVSQANSNLAAIKSSVAERNSITNAPGMSPSTIAQNKVANASVNSTESVATEASKSLMAHKGNTPGNIWARPTSTNPRAGMGVNSDESRLSPNINDKLSDVGNAVAQAGRAIGGVAKGVVNSLASGFIFADENRATGNGSFLSPKTMTALGFSQESIAQANEKEAAFDKLNIMGPGDVAATATMAVDQWSSTWIPAPSTKAAETIAVASNALGEAAPSIAVGALSGGATTARDVIGGTVASRLVGSSNAFTKEYVASGGDYGSALLAGGMEYAAEVAGSKLFSGAEDALTGNLTSSFGKGVANLSGNVISEGLEEVISGAGNAMLSGKAYTAEQARSDMLIGALVGGAAGAIAPAVQDVAASLPTATGDTSSKAYAANPDTSNFAPPVALSDSPNYTKGTGNSIILPTITDADVENADISPLSAGNEAPIYTSMADMPAITGKVNIEPLPAGNDWTPNPEPEMPEFTVSAPDVSPFFSPGDGTDYRETRGLPVDRVDEASPATVPDITPPELPDMTPDEKLLAQTLAEVDAAVQSVDNDTESRPNEYVPPEQPDANEPELQPETEMQEKKPGAVATMEPPTIDELDLPTTEIDLPTTEEAIGGRLGNLELLEEADALIQQPDTTEPVQEAETTQEISTESTTEVNIEAQPASNDWAPDAVDLQEHALSEEPATVSDAEAVEPELKTLTEAEIRRELATQTQTQVQTEAESELSLMPFTETQTQVQTQTETQPATATQTQTRLETETKTELETDVETQPQTETETQTQNQLESGTRLDVMTDWARRKEPLPQHSAGLFASPGSQGRIYDTQGYDRTFGGLSSG